MAVARGNGEPENAKVAHARGDAMRLKPRPATPPGSGKPPPYAIRRQARKLLEDGGGGTIAWHSG